MLDKPWDDEVAPVAVSFDSDPEQVTEPAPPVARVSPRREGHVATAWAADGGLLLALVAAQVWVAGSICDVKYWVDFVRDILPLAAALTAATALTYSFVFVALAGTTPGLRLAGLRVRTLHGDDPTFGEALARAVLALPSAALGLFGFVLALFDRRGQTLHDKLCRCVLETDRA
jgi:uncharacterized RDD family membrane protein YckC